MGTECGAGINTRIIDTAVAAEREPDAFDTGSRDPGEETIDVPGADDDITERIALVHIFPITWLIAPHFFF